MKIVVAITGASGSVYARRLLHYLVRAKAEIFLTISEHAAEVMRYELGVNVDCRQPDLDSLIPGAAGHTRYCDPRDIAAPIASGSFLHDGMVIIPCSGGTLGRIASGVSSDLISRAADVCLKERRRLILVPRETPLSAIHLRNMLTLTEAGAVVLPASPSFYTKPESMEELLDTVVIRVLDHLGIRLDAPRWGTNPK